MRFCCDLAGYPSLLQSLIPECLPRHSPRRKDGFGAQASQIQAFVQGLNVLWKILDKRLKIVDKVVIATKII